MKKQTLLGLGLAAIGRPDYINIRTNNSIDKSIEGFRKNASDLLDYAYELGIKHFDTAPSYGKGEQFLIDWHNKKQYQDVKFSTKWGYTYVANWEIGFSGAHEIKEHSIEKLIEQWEHSKVMLPAMNIYQVHSATIESGILENKEVLEKLNEIKEDTGLQIGITTSGINQTEVIKKALEINVNGIDLFNCFQVTYNILEQSTFPTLSELLKNGKTVIIKEGLANGRVFNLPDNPLNAILDRLATKYSVGKDAIALRFIIDNLNPQIVLSGASNKQQLNQNLKVSSFELSNNDLEEIKQNAIAPNDYWTERKRLTWN